jgi:hypothetical protein
MSEEHEMKTPAKAEHRVVGCWAVVGGVVVDFVSARGG